MLASLWKPTGLFSQRPPSFLSGLQCVTLKEHTVGWGLCCAWSNLEHAVPGRRWFSRHNLSYLTHSDPIAQAVAK